MHRNVYIRITICLVALLLCVGLSQCMTNEDGPSEGTSPQSDTPVTTGHKPLSKGSDGAGAMELDSPDGGMATVPLTFEIYDFKTRELRPLKTDLHIPDYVKVEVDSGSTAWYVRLNYLHEFKKKTSKPEDHIYATFTGADNKSQFEVTDENGQPKVFYHKYLSNNPNPVKHEILFPSLATAYRKSVKRNGIDYLYYKPDNSKETAVLIANASARMVIV